MAKRRCLVRAEQCRRACGLHGGEGPLHPVGRARLLRHQGRHGQAHANRRQRDGLPPERGENSTTIWITGCENDASWRAIPQGLCAAVVWCCLCVFGVAPPEAGVGRKRPSPSLFRKRGGGYVLLQQGHIACKPDQQQGRPGVAPAVQAAAS